MGAAAVSGLDRMSGAARFPEPQAGRARAQSRSDVGGRAIAGRDAPAVPAASAARRRSVSSAIDSQSLIGSGWLGAPLAGPVTTIEAAMAPGQPWSGRDRCAGPLLPAPGGRPGLRPRGPAGGGGLSRGSGRARVLLSPIDPNPTIEPLGGRAAQLNAPPAATGGAAPETSLRDRDSSQPPAGAPGGCWERLMTPTAAAAHASRARGGAAGSAGCAHVGQPRTEALTLQPCLRIMVPCKRMLSRIALPVAPTRRRSQSAAGGRVVHCSARLTAL